MLATASLTDGIASSSVRLICAVDTLIEVTNDTEQNKVGQGDNSKSDFNLFGPHQIFE